MFQVYTITAIKFLILDDSLKVLVLFLPVLLLIFLLTLSSVLLAALDGFLKLKKNTKAAFDGTPSQIPAFLPITFTLGSRSHKM